MMLPVMKIPFVDTQTNQSVRKDFERMDCHNGLQIHALCVTNSLVLLQKLCKNCPHPEKPFSNSKTISQIKFPYRIEKLIKSQQEWPGGKTLCRSLVTCKGFFCPVVLLLLLCENEIFH